MAGADLRVRVIVNPNAAAGSAFHRIEKLEAALRKFELGHEILLTRGPGHATELATAARVDGVDILAVMGGDGTLNEVAQSYVDKLGVPIPGPHLGVIPCGTGGDFRRTLGMSGDFEEAVGRLRHGGVRPLDLGLLRHATAEGVTVTHAFINIASFGMGGHVDAAVNRGPKWLGGRAAFTLGILRASVSYKNVSVRVKVDGAGFFEGPVNNVALANGRFFGGGIMIAPHADIQDGLLDVVVLGDLNMADYAALAPKVYRGAHLSHPKIRVGRGATVEAEAVHPWGDVLIDLDGEQPGKLPLKAWVAKGAITLRG